MKSINKILLVLIMLTGVAGIFIACDKNNDDSGTPSVSYVRITRPESSDSLLIGAGQGRLIAIVGDNLKDAVEVWFAGDAGRARGLGLCGGGAPETDGDDNRGGKSD